MQTYPQWIYPDGDATRGFLVQNESEHRTRAPGDFAAPGIGTLADFSGGKPSYGLTAPQLKDALAAKGVEIPAGHTPKADLAALLDAAE